MRFIEKVRAMREAQRNYFTSVAKARKATTPDAWDTSRLWLTRSKELESQVDAFLRDNHPLSMPPVDDLGDTQLRIDVEIAKQKNTNA
jgi:hypothetical protein